jgi:hypothetical protein
MGISILIYGFLIQGQDFVLNYMKFIGMCMSGVPTGMTGIPGKRRLIQQARKKGLIVCIAAAAGPSMPGLRILPAGAASPRMAGIPTLVSALPGAIKEGKFLDMWGLFI